MSIPRQSNSATPSKILDNVTPDELAQNGFISSRSSSSATSGVRNGPSDSSTVEPLLNNGSHLDQDFDLNDPASNLAQNSSILEDDEQQPTATAIATSAARDTTTPPTVTSQASNPKSQDIVTWRSLPKRGQLAVLVLARLSEPLSERSLSAFMYHQLQSFNPQLPDSTIASQGGTLTAAFAGAQFLTAMFWGRAADSKRLGRKSVILVGLLGTAIASIGVGFSRSYAAALMFRLMAGALNGNIGVMRTMISEMIEERKYQSRAFLLLPMCFNIGIVIGPILGGYLAEPVTSFPAVFGPGSLLGGKDGVGWMTKFPYALPNVFSGIFITISAVSVVLGLDETHHQRRHVPDRGRQLGKWLARTLFRRKDPAYAYQQLDMEETELQTTITPRPDDLESTPQSLRGPESKPSQPPPFPAATPSKSKTRSPFRQLLTPNVLLTLLSHHLLALHVSTFNALIFLFLPSPRSPSSSLSSLKGGLGLSSSKVGLATAIIGIIGLPLQLLLYPTLNTKLGTIVSYRIFLPFSALAYTLLPFLTVLPGSLLWPSLTVVLAAQVLSRTFALPSTVILVNNASPGPEVLGTLHGVAQSVSSAARMLGPTIGGWGLGEGLRTDFVGGVWWAMAGVVVLNWGLLWRIWEGDGRGGRD